MLCYDLKTMQICKITEPSVVALGTFDGAHLGHASVFASCVSLARKMGAKSVAYTFLTIPKDFFSKQKRGSIFTLEEKTRAIRDAGIDFLCTENFEDVSGLTGTEFMESVLVGELNAVGACCGFNFKFGQGASFNAQNLRDFFENRGGCVNICDKIQFGDEPLSSSLIRDFIERGEVETILSVARPYSVYSRVEHGKRLGTSIGIPTINQLFPEGKVIPADGVYITECEIGEDVYPSITNVGVRPTVESSGIRNLETHIIGFDGNLYGSYIRVNFYKRLRDEKQFSSIDELKEEIERNKKSAVEYFK